MPPLFLNSLIKMRKKSLIIDSLILSFLTFPFTLWAEEINPLSYRHDYYIIPVHNKIQEKALLPYRLNWKKPSVALGYPAEVTDREGNKTVLQEGERRVSASRDGHITYFANNTKTHTKKILPNGNLYLFRVYRGGGPLRRVEDEFGNTVGWEEYGLDGKLLFRYDAVMRPLYKYDYINDQQYWEYDFVNNLWKRYDKDTPVEERMGSKNGPELAYWIRGEFLGKYGLWRIEKGWDGERITDMFYTLYDPYGKEWYEVYHKDGYLVRRASYKNHRLILEENLVEFSYRKYGDFGLEEEKYIENHLVDAVWRYEYKGSRLTRAVRNYPDQDYYDVRIYDSNQNIDKVVRVSKETGKVLSVLEDRIYFSEVKNLTVEEIEKFFHTSPRIATSIYEWIQEMEKRNKADSGLWGIFDPNNYTLTLFDENNNPDITLLLLP